MAKMSTYEELEQRVKELEEEIVKGKWAEKAILESEEKFRLFYERVPICYQSLDEHGHFLEVNQMWLDTLGYARDEVIGKSFGDFLHPDWAEHFKQNFSRFKAAGEISCVEFEMMKKDGSFITVTFNGKIGRDEKGEFKQTHCILNDVSSQKASEDALWESKEKHQILFDTMLHGVIYHDSNGKIIGANPAAGDILGMDIDEITSRTIIDSRWQIIREDGSCFQEETRPSRVVLQTGRPAKDVVMGVFNAKENKYRWVVVNAVPIFRPGENKPFQVHMTFTDITMRKQFENELLEETRQKEKALALLDALFESAPIGLGFWDRNLRFVRLNKALADMNGFPIQDHIGRTVDEVLPKLAGLQEITNRWQRILKTGEPALNVEVRGETYAYPGRTRQWMENWYPVQVGGKIIGIAATALDITERKVAEGKLQYYAKRLRIIHDIDRAILVARSAEEISRAALFCFRKLIPSVRSSVVTFDMESGEARVFVVDIDGKTNLGPGSLIPMEIFGDIEEFKKGRVNILEDIQNLSHLPQVTQPLIADGVRSFMNFPLLSMGRLIGSLNLGSATPGSLKEEYLDIAREVADSLAIAIQNALLHDEIIRHQKHLQGLSAHLIDAQEIERKRIAMELHDEMGQSLTAIGINLAGIEKDLTPKVAPAVKEKLADTIALIEQTADQIRDLSLSLRPSLLDDFGLVPALRWFLDNCSKRYNLDVDFKAIGLDERLEAPIELAIYRVSQEALHNIVKHAEATSVMVHLEHRQNVISAFIEDNGKGFDGCKAPTDDDRQYGVGLIGMRERLATLNGTLDIQSRQGRGTRISLEIPLQGMKRS